MAGPTICLMGLRGSGKTTVGRAAARALGRAFVDLDDETLALMRAERPGAGLGSIAEAFARVGERGFREAEARALAHALTVGERVLALGGGTPTAPGAEELLMQARRLGRAVVVYLRAEPETLRARLMADPGLAARPSLTGRGTVEEVEEVFAARDPVYSRLADVVVDASTPVEACAGRVVEAARE